MYLYGILGAVVLGAIYYGLTRWQKSKAGIKNAQERKSGKAKEPGLKDLVPVIIYDDTTVPPRKINTEMEYKQIKKIVQERGSIGRSLMRDGTRLYPFWRKIGENGKKELHNLPKAPLSQSPRALHDDLTMPELAFTHDMSEDKEFLEKYGQVLWWVAVMFFIMFLWVNA